MGRIREGKERGPPGYFDQGPRVASYWCLISKMVDNLCHVKMIQSLEYYKQYYEVLLTDLML